MIRTLDSLLSSARINSFSLGTYGKLVLVLMNFLSILLLALQILRDPWVDELWTYYYIETLNDFSTRVAGDPHPVGYYALASIVKSGFDLFFESDLFFAGWPLLKASVFLCGTTLFVGLLIMFSFGEFRKEPKKLWMISLVLPSLVIFAATFGSATDLRSYGLQSVAAVTIAIGLWINLSRDSMDWTQTLVFSFMVAILASLDVWASILAVWFFLASLIFWPKSRRKILVSGIIVPPVIILSYLAGPLAVDGLPEGRGTPTDWVFGLAAGFSFNLILAIILFLVWLVSAYRGRTSLLFFFEGVALATLVSAFVFSILFVSIFKWYVLAPVFALLSAATLFRIASHGKDYFFTVLLVAGMAFSSTNSMNSITDDAIWSSKGAIESKQHWEETAIYAEQISRRLGARTAYTNEARFMNMIMENLDFKDIDDLGSVNCANDESKYLVVVLNHASINEQSDYADQYNLALERGWSTGGVYLAPCEH